MGTKLAPDADHRRKVAMKHLIQPLIILSILPLQALAGEKPQGIIEQVSPDGSVEVYKASLENGIVDNSNAAVAEISTSVTEANKLNLEPQPREAIRSFRRGYYGNNYSGYYGNYYTGNSGYYGGYYNGYYPAYTYPYNGYSYNYYYRNRYRR